MIIDKEKFFELEIITNKLIGNLIGVDAARYIQYNLFSDERLKDKKVEVKYDAGNNRIGVISNYDIPYNFWENLNGVKEGTKIIFYFPKELEDKKDELKKRLENIL